MHNSGLRNDELSRPKGRLIRRTVALIALAVIPLAACQPGTGNVECDKIVSVTEGLANRGYQLRCDAAFAGVSNTGVSVLGWVEHSTATVWMWPEKMAQMPNSAAMMRKVATHEWGHVEQDARGRSTAYWRSVRALRSTLTDQQVREDYAEVFSYCTDVQLGVGYSFAGGKPAAHHCRAL